MASSSILDGNSFWGGTGWKNRTFKPKLGWLTPLDEGAEKSSGPANADTAQIAADSHEQTFMLVVASSAAALSCTGTLLLFPALHLVSIPITLAAAVPLFYEATDGYRNQKISVATVSALGLIGCLVLQQTTFAALINVAYYTGRRVSTWRQKLESSQTTTDDLINLIADSDVYYVRCWAEESNEEQPTIRYVLESAGDSTRQGFAKLSNLIEALRGKLAAPQTAILSTVASGQ